MIALKIIGILLIIIGVSGILLSGFSGDISVAVMVATATAVLSGIGFIRGDAAVKELALNREK